MGIIVGFDVGDWLIDFEMSWEKSLEVHGHHVLFAGLPTSISL